jgi:hypothetical protein
MAPIANAVAMLENGNSRAEIDNSITVARVNPHPRFAT